MKKTFKQRVYKTLALYNLLFLVVGVIFYYVLPNFLNYPPYSINTEFEKMIDMGLNYYVQYIFATVSVMIISNVIFILQINKINKLRESINNNIGDINDKIEKIKGYCFQIPIRLYFIHAIIPPIGTIVGLYITGAKMELASTISICLLALFVTIGLLIYVFSKRIFNDVLVEINNLTIIETKINLNSYRVRIFFQFLPLVLLIGTYAYLVVSSVAITEKGDLLFERNYSEIQHQQFYDNMPLEEAIQKLNNIPKESEKDTYFIISKDRILYQDTDEEISDFFIKYTFYLDNNNHTYGYYATNIQGAYEIFEINGEECALGIMYGASFDSGYLYIFGTLMCIMTVIVIFLIFFSKDFTNPILQISEYMKRISSGQSVDYNKKIPVTSNDELGELTESFNKILDLEKEHVETIRRNQNALIENERLSSLGQLIGGIAHNLKTPIMSISGNLQGIQDLITEYDTSLGDPDVNIDDYRAIAEDMQQLVDKTRVHLSYMSDVITAVKGQAVQLDSSEDDMFDVAEIVSRIDILMRHELKNALIELRINISDEARQVVLKGDVNSLVQVFNNIIQNAIYSYEGKANKVIDFDVSKKDNNVLFRIRDYGCGIPDYVKEKLFKEMITSKGKNGTGLGLYMSYSTIKGKFNGELEFESTVGEGTTFYITLPINE